MMNHQILILFITKSKTGSGTDGKAWFVGYIEKSDNKIYFAIYLDDMQNREVVSGNKAKEIAISILSNEV